MDSVEYYKVVTHESITVLYIFQILDLAHRNKKKVRVIGCGHSPSDICCTQDYMISLKKFNRIIQVKIPTELEVHAL